MTVKTYLKSRMIDDRLNNLAIFHIESDNITIQTQYEHNMIKLYKTSTIKTLGINYFVICIKCIVKMSIFFF
jgi:hypothetical protein